jgi:hypothetical protein
LVASFYWTCHVSVWTSKIFTSQKVFLDDHHHSPSECKADCFVFKAQVSKCILKYGTISFILVKIMDIKKVLKANYEFAKQKKVK